MLVNRCANCGRLNPRGSVVCQYCSVSLGRYRMCSRGHKNRWDAQFCGTCGDVFLSPAGPLTWQSAVEVLFLLVSLSMLGYFLWEQRAAVFVSLLFLVAILYFTGWLLRPFSSIMRGALPWLVLLRLLRRR